MSKRGENFHGVFYAVMLAAFASGWVLPGFAQEGMQPATAPAGDAKTPKTILLAADAKLLQSSSPLKLFDIYLVGFHSMKDSTEDQREAHHYCHQVNEYFA